jgi:hypothetical protein
MGGVVSLTVTVKLQVEVLPALSLAMYVTVVVPTGKVSPGLWLLVRVGVPQSSVAVGGVQVTTWSHVVRPTPVPTVILPGHPEITGGVVSMATTALPVKSPGWAVHLESLKAVTL